MKPHQMTCALLACHPRATSACISKFNSCNHLFFLPDLASRRKVLALARGPFVLCTFVTTSVVRGQKFYGDKSTNLGRLILPINRASFYLLAGITVRANLSTPFRDTTSSLNVWAEQSDQNGTATWSGI